MHGTAPDLNGSSIALSPADINALRQGHPLLRCLSVLNHVMQQPAAAPFCSQVALLANPFLCRKPVMPAPNVCTTFVCLPVMCLSRPALQAFWESCENLQGVQLNGTGLDMPSFVAQDAGFMAYFHMNGEKPIDLSIVRSRLLPGTTQVRLASRRSPWAAPSCKVRAVLDEMHVHLASR